MQAILDKLRVQSPRELDVVGLGECSLDIVYPLRGRLAELVGKKGATRAVQTLGGGQVATALCAVRRLGWRSGFLGAVGDDAAGSAVLAGLRDDDVCTTEALVIGGAATRSALILIDDDGERTVIEHRDAALKLPADYPKAAVLAAARVVHLDGTYLSASLRAARAAREAGAVVSIDLDVPAHETAELLELADLCVLPIDFVKAFTGETELARGAQHIAEKTSGQVIVTLGAAGCVALCAGGNLLHQAALRPPGAIVDTTACGDTFRAALIAWLLSRSTTMDDRRRDSLRELKDALRFAAAAAALKCQGPGRSGCPGRAAVDEFLATASQDQLP